MARIFVYDGRKLEDPDPEMTVEMVRDSYADFFGDLVNAAYKEEQAGDDTVYTFQKRVGTKGSRD